MKHDDTYAQIFYHVVFAVQNRRRLLVPAIRENVFRYMSGIITNQRQKLFIVNGVEDHVHMLLNCRPNMNLSKLVGEIKEHSTKFINDTRMLPVNFRWQAGFSAFTLAKKDIGGLIDYIKRQEEHHAKEHFPAELQRLLKEHEIEFNEMYFAWNGEYGDTSV